MTELDRRKFAVLGMTALGASALPFAAALGKMTQGRQVDSPETMEPGDFTWHPERSRSGPVSIIVSITDQRYMCTAMACALRVHLLHRQEGTLHAHRRVHHPAEGQAPPLVDLQQRADAQHEPADLEGHCAARRQPAGLPRLPWLCAAAGEVLQLLFTVTHLGTPVILANSHSQPQAGGAPGMVLSDYAEHEFEELTGKHFKTAAATAHPAA
jgi:hypothetical protein